MPEIRLSKVLKELNISIDRAVDFLEAKGKTVEKNPNSKIDLPTYDILVNEFRSDAKQKQASGEVVINKISDIKAAEKKEAEKIFTQNGMKDKLRLLRHLDLPYISLYKCEGFYDYFYGAMLS
ncbi:MAG: hypothetical protein RR447_05335, partial [Algoriella sp.]